MDVVSVAADSSQALEKYIKPGEAGLALLLGSAPFLFLGAVVIIWLLGRKDGRPPVQVAMAVILFLIAGYGGTGGLVFASGGALRLPLFGHLGMWGVFLSILAIPAALACAAAGVIAVRVVRTFADNRTAA